MVFAQCFFHGRTFARCLLQPGRVLSRKLFRLPLMALLQGGSLFSMRTRDRVEFFAVALRE